MVNGALGRELDPIRDRELDAWGAALRPKV
jgi:hypothetical protein